ncbi:hypothetical protein [Polaromonas sp. DSR2-3-2]|uniref:hypothetical protein n=1 Tax=unclassified Polaromonas TaxID=2638319 RepID=UPI003CEC1C22
MLLPMFHFDFNLVDAAALNSIERWLLVALCALGFIRKSRSTWCRVAPVGRTDNGAKATTALLRRQGALSPASFNAAQAISEGCKRRHSLPLCALLHACSAINYGTLG